MPTPEELLEIRKRLLAATAAGNRDAMETALWDGLWATRSFLGALADRQEQATRTLLDELEANHQDPDCSDLESVAELANPLLDYFAAMGMGQVVDLYRRNLAACYRRYDP